MSQAELAKKLGYTNRSTISKIESGENDVTQSTLEKIAKALRTTPAYLLGGETTQAEDDEVWELRDQLHKRPEMKILFDASRKATKEDIETVASLMEKLAKNEEYDD
jgi:transcriptional regulator with XRE-family HTH domain